MGIVLALGSVALLAPGNETEPFQAPFNGIVFATMPGCSGCVMMEPEIMKLERKGYFILRVGRELFPEYRVRGAPTTIIYRNGAEVKRFENFVSAAEIEPYLNKVGGLICYQ